MSAQAPSSRYCFPSILLLNAPRLLHTWSIQSQWNAPTVVSGSGAWFIDQTRIAILISAAWPNAATWAINIQKVIARSALKPIGCAMGPAGLGSEPAARVGGTPDREVGHDRR